MATLINILYLVQCGASAILGTGTTGCKQFLKRVVSVWLHPDGFVFDPTETFSLAYIETEQKKGNIIVLKDIVEFTVNTSEDQVETLPDGTMQTVTLGKYAFALKFINGLAFMAALRSLASFGDYNATFIDRDNNIMGTKADNGSLKGMSIGMLQNDPLSFASDTEAQKEGLKFQFTDRDEIDQDYAFIQGSQLDFSPKRLDGIQQVDIAITTPVNLDTTFVAKMTLRQNKKPFVGAVLADVVVQVNGATVTPSGVVESPDGTYTFTVAALATNDVVTVQLFDTANTYSVVKVGSVLAQSKTATSTVIA